MATQIKGPAVFLAQFMTGEPPRNSLEGLARWAAGLGFKGGRQRARLDDER